MKYAIDETELARLEALAKSVGVIGYSEHAGIEERTYIAAACNAVPALVAEVRRLREKVEAWEWWDEVADLNEDTFWCSFLSRSAANEMCDTYLAAREAIC